MKIFLMPHLYVPLKSLKFNYRKMMNEKKNNNNDNKQTNNSNTNDNTNYNNNDIN